MIILNEKKFIEDILNEKNKIIAQERVKSVGIKKTATMIAQLYNIDVTKKELIDIVKSNIKDLNIPNYYEFRYDTIFNSICKNVIDKNLKLKEFDFIPVYKEELDFINEFCDNDREKKFMFVCFVIGRYNNGSGWVNTSLTELFKLSNIHLSKEKQDDLIYVLTNNKKILDKNKSNNKFFYHVNLIESDNIAIKVDKFENLGNVSLAYFKSKTHKQCSICGKLIKVTGNKIKYCDECQKKIRQEKKIDYNKLQYEKRKEVEN